MHKNMYIFSSKTLNFISKVPYFHIEQQYSSYLCQSDMLVKDYYS